MANKIQPLENDIESRHLDQTTTKRPFQPTQAVSDTEILARGLSSRSYVEGIHKNFGLISLGSIGLVVGNVWPALGGSIGTSIFNGAAPGVLYEFVAVAVCYFAVAATLAELASALPSSSGVYLWASVTPGQRYGRAVGYFAGWWNCLAWIFGEASMALIASG